MNPRPYRSPLRAAAAGITRKRIINAASALLGAPKGFEGFSLDAVARKARVTRLTVYNQFGSRRALLEEVFDDIAARAACTGSRKPWWNRSAPRSPVHHCHFLRLLEFRHASAVAAACSRRRGCGA